MTNKYVCVNDQTCSAKIYVLLFAKFFAFGIFMDRDEFEVSKIAKQSSGPQSRPIKTYVGITSLTLLDDVGPIYI